MKKLITAVAAIFCLIGSGTILGADVGKCPVSGKAAKEDSYRIVNGEKVHFCCNNCPKSYETKLNVKDEGAKKCPISGEDAVAETRQLHAKTEAVYFCCAKCNKKFTEEQKLTVKDQGPGKCPISGKPAKAGSSLVHNGETIYFCCDNCPKSYMKKLSVTDKGAKKCPVSGEDAVADQQLVFTKTEAVYFCCNNCAKKYGEKNFSKTE